MLTALAYLAVASNTGGAYTLQRQLVPGERDAYTIKTYAETAKGSSTAQFVFQIGKLIPAKHAAEVEVSGSVQQGIGDEASKPFTAKTSGLLDVCNRFEATKSELTATGLLSPGEGAASDVFLELPSHPIRVGETWNVPLVGAATIGVPDQVITATLLGPAQIHGHAVWRVKLESSGPFSMDLKKIIRMGQPTEAKKREFDEQLRGVTMTATGLLTYTGLAMVDQQTGKTVTMRCVAAEDAHVRIVSSRKDVRSMSENHRSKTETTLVLNGY